MAAARSPLNRRQPEGKWLRGSALRQLVPIWIHFLTAYHYRPKPENRQTVFQYHELLLPAKCNVWPIPPPAKQREFAAIPARGEDVIVPGEWKLYLCRLRPHCRWHWCQ